MEDDPINVREYRKLICTKGDDLELDLLSMRAQIGMSSKLFESFIQSTGESRFGDIDGASSWHSRWSMQFLISGS